MNLKDTYNKIAKDWHKDHQSDDWWVEGTDAFISFLKQGDLVLDVGCAGGFKSKYLINKGLSVLGIDFSENLIEIAKKEVSGAEFLVMDMREVNTLHQKFDGIFAQASLLHLPKKETPEIIKKFFANLKSGGYLYVAVKGARDNISEEEVKEENDYGYSYERFFSYYTTDEIKKYFADAGFEIVYENISEVSSTWIQIIGRKLK